MPSRKLATATLVAGLAVAGSAFADRQNHAVSRFTYADVVDVKPLIRTVEIEVPVRECFDQVRREPPRRERSIGRTIAGGIIGGLIGSQIGDGSGRDVATVAGTLIGAASASERGREHRAPQVERFCETRYEYETRDRVEGFRVTYQYRGETFVTRTRTDPGDRIRVKVSVAPVVD